MSCRITTLRGPAPGGTVSAAMMTATRLATVLCVVAGCSQAARTPPSRQVAGGNVLAELADTIAPPAAPSRTFELYRGAAQRDSLRAVTARQRESWRALGIGNYRLLVHTACFCPGPRGWMLVRVRAGVVSEVWDERGRRMPVNQDSNYSVDRLFDLLEQWAGNMDAVEVRFDRENFFPSDLQVDYRRGLPDDWGITRVRGLKQEN